MDSCIWRDYFEDRKDGIRPLGELAFQFLKNCEKKNVCIIVSDAVVFELEARLSKEQVKRLFLSFGNIVLKVTVNAKQVSGTRKEWKKRNKKIPFNDVLHAIMAKDNKAILVTRDRHFFDERFSIIQAEKPEDITLD